LSKTKPHENPLVNNKKLKQLYVAMAQARVLDEHLSGLRRKRKSGARLDSTCGQEACRVSTAIELVDGDLVSDAQRCVVMDLIAGATVRSVMRSAALLVARADVSQPKATTSSIGPQQLPWIEDPVDRLQMAVGAAMAFKALKRPNIVVAYVRTEEVGEGVWQRTLELASKFVLPIIFVVLPVEQKSADVRARGAVEAARSKSIPGIPVDASDAVALYRVAQESIGRTRGGDGPVVIECVTFAPEGHSKKHGPDPLLLMKGFMLGRQVCSEPWFYRVGTAFRKKLEAASLDG
jgi:TPP-dependent pyruvate/acetoin dehydrogenase alpha subunit